jgi:Virulence factor
MARYRVMSWRDIPSQVTASDDDGASVSRSLPTLFQQEIDRVAMAEGLTGTDDYLEAWAWSIEHERPGDAASVAAAVAEEVAAAWLKARSDARPQE